MDDTADRERPRGGSSIRHGGSPTMRLADILTHEVETIPPTASIKEAAQRMRSMDVGSLPVCDGQRLLGMVTDRDLTIRMLAEGRDPVATPVSEAMTPDVRYCFA